MKAVEIIRPYVRNGAFPIDALSVFSSYSEALNYAYTDPSAYPTQIIGIDDKISEKTAIYRISYDPNKIHRYILERIEVGNGSNIFNFKGSVPTFDQLPKEDIKQGEMWLVEDQNKFFISFVDPENNIQWKELTVSIQRVTKSNDGILSKEVYKTLFNDNQSDAVYFSKKSNEVSAIPEDNRWINIEHTSKENILSYSLPSVGMVKEIISGVMEQTIPHIEIDSDIDEDNPVDSQIKPTLIIKYYKEFGGNPVHVKIIRYINDEDKHEVFNGYPHFIKTMSSRSEVLTWIWNESELVTAVANNSVRYEVIIDYDDSIDSNLSAGTCRNTKYFYFYKIIKYGHNLKEYEPVFLKENNIIDLKYNPNSPEFKDKSINEIYIRLPITATLEEVEYVPQHDHYAIDLFNESTEGGYEKLYTYKLFGNLRFTSPGEFIFKVRL